MTDKKLTDKEIKKALESYIKDIGCAKCGFKDKYLLAVLDNTLDLITRQQAIVEKSEKVEYFADKTIVTLQAENERLEVENQSLRSAANSLKMHYEEAQAEIERLNKVYQANQQLINALNKSYFLAKAEAYKEFAEKAIDRVEKARQKYQRLCKEQGEEMEEHMHIHFNGIIGIINNLLKELVGEDNA